MSSRLTCKEHVVMEIERLLPQLRQQHLKWPLVSVAVVPVEFGADLL